VASASVGAVGLLVLGRHSGRGDRAPEVEVVADLVGVNLFRRPDRALRLGRLDISDHRAE